MGSRCFSRPLPHGLGLPGISAAAALTALVDRQSLRQRPQHVSAALGPFPELSELASRAAGKCRPIYSSRGNPNQWRKRAVG